MTFLARVSAKSALLTALLAVSFLVPPVAARPAEPASGQVAAPAAPTVATNPGPMLPLGVGDSVSVQVYGRPELTLTTYVADDGSVPVPLAGRVPVAGLAPAEAAEHIAAAYRDAKYRVDPQVTVLLLQSRSQQVSVLGAVARPGRYVIEGIANVMDLLAQAGGVGENGARVVYLLRPGKDGKVERTPLDLNGLSRAGVALPATTLRGGDSVFVPQADQFYVYGEVASPNMYRLEPGMTVEQALSRSGGVTARGSRKRIEIRRRESDGSYVTRAGELAELVHADDVIRVKERIF
jgi:polysaccharide export outer membrane protein